MKDDLKKDGLRRSDDDWSTAPFQSLSRGGVKPIDERLGSVSGQAGLLSRRAAAHFLKLYREKLDNAIFLPALPHPKKWLLWARGGCEMCRGAMRGVEFVAWS